ncbi:hypothetical protein BVRB_4g088500 [Beta vulgaris subsp. vulgaris]|nr:hypothetical protein BVRB_4g088500 [Beta vulgaris subsp. vulgaris]
MTKSKGSSSSGGPKENSKKRDKPIEKKAWKCEFCYENQFNKAAYDAHKKICAPAATPGFFTNPNKKK